MKNTGGISQLVKPGIGRPGYRGDDARKSAAKMGKGAMGTTRHGPAPGSHHPPGPTKPDHRGHHSGDGPSVYKPVTIPKKPKDYYKDKSEKAYQKAKKIAQIKNIKPVGSWTQKGLYGILPNDPKLALNFLNSLQDEDPEIYDSLPQELKNLIEGPPSLSARSDKLDFDEWSVLSQVPGYGEFLSERGKPGVLNKGDLSKVGDRYVKYTVDEFGNKIKQKDKFGNVLYGYHEPTGGEGGDRPLWMRLGYGSEAEYRNAGGGGGGSSNVTTPVVPDTPSEFQQSLNTGIAQGISPYYVGANPIAANLAWGQQFNVDPRTMYRTTWADGGPIRQRYFLGKLVKKIGRAAKKIVKSPIGKIGALAAGAYFMPGIGAKAAGGWGPWAEGLKGKFGIKQLLTKEGLGQEWDPWKLGIGALTAAPFLMGKGEEEEPDKAFDYDAAKNAYVNELMKIKRDAMAGTLDPSQFVYQGIKDGGRIGYAGGGSEDPLLVEEYKKYVFEMEEMGLQPMSFEEFKAEAISGMASGGRAGFYSGGQSIPSENTIEDARKTAMQDRLGGITEVMKQADLFRQGDVGQMYMADGGDIDYSKDPNYKGWKKTYETNKDAAAMNENHAQYLAYYNRTKKADGGIMDLGGVEKDYRETGGFVPIGEYEKKDDVPARLSLNEFVMTADAVRGMGDGDIDKGAERMEDLMETLEVKGKRKQGAQDMFEVSERLSAVV